MPKVPHSALSPEALGGLIEEFVSREGTDYGGPVATLEEKVAQVQRQLERGEAIVFFDPTTETCNIVPVREGKVPTPEPKDEA